MGDAAPRRHRRARASSRGVTSDTLAGHPAVRITAVADLDAARVGRGRRARSRAPGAARRRAARGPDVQTGAQPHDPGGARRDRARARSPHGKNVYGEKPLAATFAEARAVIDAAAAAGVRVGCAPDTVLGTGIQTARAAIDAGRIGRPIAASAVMVTPGHEAWHPHPDFYYAAGGGPLLDMGPYYLTALVQLLGPVRAVSAARRVALRASGVIGSGPRAGERIPVEVDTPRHRRARARQRRAVDDHDELRRRGAPTAAPIEVHGETGTLAVPDPNHFDGEVRLFDARRTTSGARSSRRPATPAARRGVGLLDFIAATASGPRERRRLALHVLEIDDRPAGVRSAKARRIELTTTAERPTLVPLTPYEEWSRQ